MIEVRNPASGAHLGTVPVLDDGAVAALVAAARAAQPGWAARSVQERCEVLLRLRKWLLANADDVIAALVAETGKPWEDAAMADVVYTCQALSFWSQRAAGWLADERVPASSPAVLGRRLVVRQVPRGVVGVIAPWNAPIANALGDCIPALAAGNAVILKPSEETPLISLRMAQALTECGMPAGAFSVATGRGATGAALVDNVDMIMFTGSAASGRLVAERAGRRLIPVSLELGGKDPMIVLRDADLARAADAAVYYGMQNAGQICISVERVYVEERVYDEFVANVCERVRALRQGNPGAGAGSVEIGATTLPSQLDVVQRHVDDAIARGARALTGGRRGTGPGDFYEPTVLVDVEQEMACMQEETFGPTLPIMRVSDVDEAVRLANDSPYGLGASVFCADARQGEDIARRLEAGNVAVNDVMVYFGAPEVPMGGWKQSGLGTRHGAGGIGKYCRTQTIVAGRHISRLDPQFFPYRRWRSRAILKVTPLLRAGLKRRASRS